MKPPKSTRGAAGRAGQASTGFLLVLAFLVVALTGCDALVDPGPSDPEAAPVERVEAAQPAAVQGALSMGHRFSGKAPGAQDKTALDRKTDTTSRRTKSGGRRVPADRGGGKD